MGSANIHLIGSVLKELHLTLLKYYLMGGDNMAELFYKIEDWEIKLYKLEDGKAYFVADFRDREDLLIYIEENYDMANLRIVGGDLK